MDVDAAFIDHTIDLRLLFALQGIQKTLHISLDAFWQSPCCNGSYVNSGVWAIRSSTEALPFLEAWWEAPVTYNEPGMKREGSGELNMWDQGAINRMLLSEGSLGREHIEVHPPCHFYGYDADSRTFPGLLGLLTDYTLLPNPGTPGTCWTSHSWPIWPGRNGKI